MAPYECKSGSPASLLTVLTVLTGTWCLMQTSKRCARVPRVSRGRTTPSLVSLKLTPHHFKIRLTRGHGKSSAFPDKCLFLSICTQWQYLWIKQKALNPNKVYKAFVDAWVTATDLKGCSSWTDKIGHTPNLPYLRQPPGPQSILYQRCRTRYFKHRQLTYSNS